MIGIEARHEVLMLTKMDMVGRAQEEHLQKQGMVVRVL